MVFMYRWLFCGPVIKGRKRKVDDLVSLIDLAPTFLDMAHIDHFNGITGKSLMPIFSKAGSGIIDTSRHYILSGPGKTFTRATRQCWLPGQGHQNGEIPVYRKL